MDKIGEKVKNSIYGMVLAESGIVGKEIGEKAWGRHSSMNLAVIDSLSECGLFSACMPYFRKSIIQNFLKWAYEGKYTSDGKVVDMDSLTSDAIIDFARNGDRMAVADKPCENVVAMAFPLAVKFRRFPPDMTLDYTKYFCSMMTSNRNSILSSFYFSLIIQYLLDGFGNVRSAYTDTNEVFSRWTGNGNECFGKVLSGKIDQLDSKELACDGNAIGTLETALWCVLKANSYQDAVSGLMTLEKPSGASGCVTGSLAGLVYGVPAGSLERISNREYIDNITDKYLEGV